MILVGGLFSADVVTNINGFYTEKIGSMTSSYLLDDNEASHVNSSSDHATIDSPYEAKQEIKYITLVLYMCVFVVGFAGNTLVLYVIAKFPVVRRKSVANYYIWNLALADALCVLALPLFCWATFRQQWPLGGVLGSATCKVSYAIRDVCKFSSVYTLAALSIDRCFASYRHLGALRTIGVGKTVLVVIWIACAIVSAPYFRYAEMATRSDNVTTSCRLEWPPRYAAIWIAFQFVVGFTLPSTIILAAYAILFRRLRRITYRSGVTCVARPSKRMLHTVLCVVSAFIMCQTPYYVMQWISLARLEEAEQVIQTGSHYRPPSSQLHAAAYFNLAVQLLVFASSCCNPIIYGLLNDNYRSLYRRVLCRTGWCCCCCCCCNHGDGRSTATAAASAAAAADEYVNDDKLDSRAPNGPTPRLRFEITFHSPCDQLQSCTTSTSSRTSGSRRHHVTVGGSVADGGQPMAAFAEFRSGGGAGGRKMTAATSTALSGLETVEMEMTLYGLSATMAETVSVEEAEKQKL